MTAKTAFTLLVLVFLILTVQSAWQLTADVREESQAPASLTEFDVNASVDQRREYWASRIRAVGGGATYEEFAQFIAVRSDTGESHYLSHDVGAALYQELGVEGLAICDSRFYYGCFHEFSGQVIADMGLEAVSILNESCLERGGWDGTSCQHGLGHGLITAIGYESSDLTQALEICDELKDNEPVNGCQGGAFMEYNVRTMLAEGGKVRPVGESLADPCDWVGDSYQMSCMFWQPRWWRYGMFADEAGTSELFKRMGTFCEEIAINEEVKHSCFSGIGYITTSETAYDPATARSLCEATSEDTSASVHCLAMVASHIKQHSGSEEGAKVCENLTEGEKTYCEAWAE